MADPIYFLQYDKISDTLMYFSKDVLLKFNVNLSYTNQKNKKRIPFHVEYAYNSSKGDYKAYSIKRQISCYFSIEDITNFDNNILIRTQDIVLLRMLLQNNILPWIMGSTRIYGFDEDNNLIIKGKFTKVDFPLSDYKFISFFPIVINYTDNTSKEGIRMIINKSDNVVDIDINKFMEFYYFISDMDMYSVASSMLAYVKMQPYGENLYDMVDSANSTNSKWNSGYQQYKGNDFFNNL